MVLGSVSDSTATVRVDASTIVFRSSGHDSSSHTCKSANTNTMEASVLKRCWTSGARNVFDSVLFVGRHLWSINGTGVSYRLVCIVFYPGPFSMSEGLFFPYIPLNIAL